MEMFRHTFIRKAGVFQHSLEQVNGDYGGVG